MSKRTSVLFVCMGNICRSPLAEGIFLHTINRRGIADRFSVDSAGTGGWHAGSRPDPRAIAVAERRGVVLPSRARVIQPEDFTRFDHLLCMDRVNERHLLRIGAPRERLRLMLSVDPNSTHVEVPDPYEGDEEDFELVYRLLESACSALADELVQRHGLPTR